MSEEEKGRIVVEMDYEMLLKVMLEPVLKRLGKLDKRVNYIDEAFTICGAGLKPVCDRIEALEKKLDRLYQIADDATKAYEHRIALLEAVCDRLCEKVLQ